MPDSKPENVEDDWLTHFFDKSCLISDKGMQNIWANILAGESNQPGSFSKRTADLAHSYGWWEALLAYYLIKIAKSLQRSESISQSYLIWTALV